MQGFSHRTHSPISLTLPLSNPSDLASQQLQLSGYAAMRASVIPFIADLFGVIFTLTYIILLRDGRRSCLLVPLRRAPLPTVQGRYASALRQSIFSYSISIPLSSSWPARIAVGVCENKSALGRSHAPKVLTDGSKFQEHANCM